MNFFKQNKDITVGLVVTLLASGWLFWQVLSNSGVQDDIIMSLEDEKQQIEELQEKEFVVSSDNSKVVKDNIKQLTANVDDLKTSLRKYNLTIDETMTIAAYTDMRDNSLAAMKKALKDKGIAVNSKFAELSLKDLKEDTQPTAEERIKGLYRLAILKEVINQLPEPSGDILTEGAAINSIEYFKWNKDLFVDSSNGDVRYIPFEIQIVGDEKAVRQFTNGVCSNEALFATVRAIEYSNPVTFGLIKKDGKKTVAATPKLDKDGKPIPAEPVIEYKEDRQVVNNNKVIWKVFFDFIQIVDKPAKEVN